MGIPARAVADISWLRSTKVLSVNSRLLNALGRMLSCRVGGLLPPPNGEEGGDGKASVLGSVRRVLGDCRTLDPGAKAGSVQRLPSQTWCGSKAVELPAGFRGDRLCVADRLPVEIPAPGAVRQPQFGPCLFPAVAGPRLLPGFVEGRFGRVRRPGRHRLGMAEH